MNHATADQRSTETIELPTQVAGLLRAEARKTRLSVPEMIMRLLEDQADARESKKRLAEIKSGKAKAIPWADARKELLEAP